MRNREQLVKDIAHTLNRYSTENESGFGCGVDGTPDFILAEYLLGCLEAFNEATKLRALWYMPEGEAKDEAAFGPNGPRNPPPRSWTPPAEPAQRSPVFPANVDDPTGRGAPWG